MHADRSRFRDVVRGSVCGYCVVCCACRLRAERGGTAMRSVLVFAIVVLGLSNAGLGGGNHAAEVAVHVKAHSAKQTCPTLPTISDSSDIVTTYEGSSFDFFPVFFSLTEFRGVEYGVTWPDWTYSCAFTSCSDLVIGDIESPGDGISHSWFDCQMGQVVIPGWGWLYADSAGIVCITEHPSSEAIYILDCNQGLDEPVANFCAGVYGATGDDPTSNGRGGDGPEGTGTSGGIRGYYRP